MNITRFLSVGIAAAIIATGTLVFPLTPTLAQHHGGGHHDQDPVVTHDAEGNPVRRSQLRPCGEGHPHAGHWYQGHHGNNSWCPGRTAAHHQPGH